MKKTLSGIRSQNVEELVWRKNFGNAELEIVGREGWRPRGAREFFWTIQSEDAMGAAELRVAEGGRFGFGEGAKLAGAAVNNFGGELRFEGGSFCARTLGVGKNVEVGEGERFDEAESSFVMGFGFTGKTCDDVRTYGGVGEKFADEVDAAGVVFGAIPAVHGGEDGIGAGLERHVEVPGDAVRAGEESDEVLCDILRLDGADAKTGEGRFIENTAKKIQDIGAGRKIASPRT